MITISIRTPKHIGINVRNSDRVALNAPPIQTIVKNIFPDYSGSLDIVPGIEEQILETADTLVRGNIRIAPVPSNYGKIEYDGAALRIV